MKSIGHNCRDTDKQIMYGKTKTLALLIGIILVMLWFVIQHNRIDFDNLSLSQLATSGYYVYILPEQIQESLNWTRTIQMRSFDFHCITDMDSRDDRWNPIQIRYSSLEGNEGMVIWMSPYDAMFNRREAESVTQISPDNTHYEIDSVGRLRFVDDLGIDVVVVSTLELDALLPIISELVRAGYEGRTNPWGENCAEN